MRIVYKIILEVASCVEKLASSEFKFDSSFSGMYIFEKLSLKLFLRVTMKGAKLRKKNLG